MKNLLRNKAVYGIAALMVVLLIGSSAAWWLQLAIGAVLLMAAALASDAGLVMQAGRHKRPHIVLASLLMLSGAFLVLQGLGALPRVANAAIGGVADQIAYPFGWMIMSLGWMFGSELRLVPIVIAFFAMMYGIFKLYQRRIGSPS